VAEQDDLSFLESAGGIIGRTARRQRQQAAINAAMKLFRDMNDPDLMKDPANQYALQLDRASVAGELAKAGVDAKQLFEGVQAPQRAQWFAEAIGKLSPEQQINAINEKDVAPVNLSGGVAYNRYDPKNPIVGESSAVQALGDLRRSQIDTEGTKQAANLSRAGLYDARTADVDVRRQVVEDFVTNPEADPLLAVDAANKRQVFKPKQIKVRRRDGTTVYMDQTPNLSGGFDYALAQAGGEDLVVPPQSYAPERATANQKNAELIAETYDIPFDEALELTLLDGRTRSRKLQKIKEAKKAGQAPGASGGRSAQPTQPARPQQAQPGTSQGSGYRSPQDVKAAFRAGKLSQEQAEAELRRFGFR
jgi:hypothetical protein